jgi:hypothetical protein
MQRRLAAERAVMRCEGNEMSDAGAIEMKRSTIEVSSTLAMRVLKYIPY